LALLEDFRPALGTDIARGADERAQSSAGGPREWVVDFEEARLSPAQTSMLAQVLGQVCAPSRPGAAAPYRPTRLRAGIAFDKTA
jgi:hypothetical protein